MSIETLKNSLEEFEKTHPMHPLFKLNDTSAQKLLILTCKCLIQLFKETMPEKKQDDEPWMSLMEFYDKTHLCHPSTLARLLSNDRTFFDLCGSKKGAKYQIKMKAALEYLSQLPTFKFHQRAYKIINNLKKEELCAATHTSNINAGSYGKLLTT